MREIKIEEVKKEQNRLRELLKTAGTGITLDKQGEICLVVFIQTDKFFNCPLKIEQRSIARFQAEHPEIKEGE